MPQYLILFNQQWVGDHPAEWYDSRGPLARAVVADMREAGVLVFAGGLVEQGGPPVQAVAATASTSGSASTT